MEEKISKIIIILGIAVLVVGAIAISVSSGCVSLEEHERRMYGGE